MNKRMYWRNGAEFGWGPKVAKVNPDKLKFLKKFAKGKVLDVACGSGVYTKALHKLGHKAQGVDLHPSFIKLAKRKYPKIKFLVASAEKLPFKNDQFDTVVLFDILEHVDDKTVLTEGLRVAKRVIISVPRKNQRQLLEFGLSHAHYLDQTHLRVYRKKDLRKLFKGLKVKRVVYLENALPLSVSGLLIERLSDGVWWKRVILKTILKPFLPEPEIFSTVFAVVEK